MMQPIELKMDFPIALANGVRSTTSRVWSVLTAASRGDLNEVKELAASCPELLYAQYNYTPPIHFAVREGHLELVNYLLAQGAYDPNYKIYPFLDSLETMAKDRGYWTIFKLLEDYRKNGISVRFKGDLGQIYYRRDALHQKFEHAVDKGDLEKTKQLLTDHPDLINDPMYFWGEGILMMPAKAGNFKMIELLMNAGARFPDVSKWSRFYYFERYDSTAFILDHGMNPNHMSWHRVTILHDMAQIGNIPKAKLLLDHGASIDPVDEEYCSTPLGIAARWGQEDMVRFLLEKGADPGVSGADWSTPLAWARQKGYKEIENIFSSL